MKKVDQLFSYFSSNFLLFTTCAGIWGSTWLVIKSQINGTDPIVSVFLRFLLSTIILLGFTKITGKSLSYPRSMHLNFFFQGACNFSLNYILTYWAEIYAPSASIALMFTLLVAYNIFGMKIFFKKEIHRNVYFGTAAGILGVFFIFSHELTTLELNESRLKGLSLGLVATLFASAGNLLSYRNHIRKVPVTVANTWGMFYGTIVSLVIALALNKPFHIESSWNYWISLIYLSLFGTVIAFGAYLTLVGRIGAERASYTTILSPVIAVILSIIFEEFKVSKFIFLGILFSLSGIFITIHKNDKKTN